jgi:hypothetical protein
MIAFGSLKLPLADCMALLAKFDGDFACGSQTYARCESHSSDRRHFRDCRVPFRLALIR